MHDSLSDRRNYRLFNVIDDHNQKALGMEIELSLLTYRMIRSLDQIIEWRGKPKILRCDNGPEYISHKLQKWTDKHGIKIAYTQPGNLQQNAYGERCNQTVRYDWLTQDIFEPIEEVQEKATHWLWHYNNERPNMA
jgi:putative transposase